MTNYTLWADQGTGSQDIYKIAKYLKECAGGSVNVLGIGPSVGQNYGLHNGKGTVAVYQTNGVGIATPNDLNMGCKPGGYYQYDRAIFVWPQWIGNQYMSNSNIVKHVVPGEWDWNRDSSYNVGGQTAAQWFPNAQYVDLVAGSSPQDVAQRICNGAYVTSSGNPGSSSGGFGSSGSTSGGDGGGSSDSGVSPLLQGDMTFEELVGEICNGIDLMFLTKRSTVVVEDFESIYAEAKYLRDKNSKSVKAEDISFWQLEEDSYELEVNQHGFYNTVYVQYKGGTVKEAYDEFVRVYGEIPITYKEPKIDKTTAQMKAKAYLAAHVRDFEMTVNLSMLTEGDIDIGDIVTVDNPLTENNKKRRQQKRDPEYLFVNGVSTNWEGDSYLSTDLELKFAPTSPQKLDVPTSGTATGKNASDNNSSSPSETGGAFDSCGLSQDKKTICAIGKPSASGESSYGYTFYRSVFKNHCPFCGSDSLVWGIFWAGESTDYGYLPCKGTSEGGSIEGHVFCKNCDADFSCILGRDHMPSPRASLTRVSGPVKVSKEDAYKLKKGIYSF